MAGENFRERFRQSSKNNGSPRTTRSLVNNKEAKAADRLNRRGLATNQRAPSNQYSPVPKKALSLFAIGGLIAVCVWQLVQWWDFGDKIPVFISLPHPHELITEDLVPYTPAASKDWIDDLNNQPHLIVKNSSQDDQNLVDLLNKDGNKLRALQFGGANRNLTIFYVNNYMTLGEDETDILVLGSPGSPVSKEALKEQSLSVLFQRICDLVPDRKLAIVALDLKFPTNVTNFAFLKFPADRIEKAYDKLEKEQKEKLLVLLPSRGDGASWISPLHQRSFFGAHFLHGIKTNFGETGSLDTFLENLSQRVQSNVSSFWSANQVPKYLYADNIKLDRFAILSPKSKPSQEPLNQQKIEINYKPLNELWKNYFLKYPENELWKLTWEETSQKLKTESELLLLESLVESSGSIASALLVDLEKRLTSNEVASPKFTKMITDYLSRPNADGIDDAWEGLRTLSTSNGNPLSKTATDDLEDSALYHFINVLLQELGEKSLGTPEKNQRRWIVAKDLITNYIALLELNHQSNPGYFTYEDHVKDLKDLNAIFLKSVDNALCLPKQEKEFDKFNDITKEKIESIKANRDKYHKWLNHSRMLASMVPSCLSYLQDRQLTFDKNKASETKETEDAILKNLGEACKLNARLVDNWDPNSLDELNSSVGSVKILLKTLLDSDIGKSTVGESVSRIRSALRCVELSLDSRIKYHEYVSNFLQTGPNFLATNSGEHQFDQSKGVDRFQEIKAKFLAELSNEGSDFCKSIYENQFKFDVRLDSKWKDKITARDLRSLREKSHELLCNQLALGSFLPTSDRFVILDEMEDKEFRQRQFDRYCLERWGNGLSESLSRSEQEGKYPFAQLANAIKGQKDLNGDQLDVALRALDFGFDPNSRCPTFQKENWADAGPFALIDGGNRIPILISGEEVANDSTNSNDQGKLMLAMRGHRKLAEPKIQYSLEPQKNKPASTEIALRVKPVSTSIAILLDCSISMKIKPTTNAETKVGTTNFDLAKETVKMTLESVKKVAKKQPWKVVLIPFGYNDDTIPPDKKYLTKKHLTKVNDLKSTWKTVPYLVSRDGKDDTKVLNDIIDSLDSEGLYDTPLYNSIGVGLEHLRNESAEHKILLVLSDGADRPVIPKVALEELRTELKKDPKLQFLFYQLKIEDEQLRREVFEGFGNPTEEIRKEKANNTNFKDMLKSIGKVEKSFENFPEMRKAIESQIAAKYSLIEHGTNEKRRLRGRSGSSEQSDEFDSDDTMSLLLEDRTSTECHIEMTLQGKKRISPPFQIYKDQKLSIDVPANQSDGSELRIDFETDTPLGKNFVQPQGGIFTESMVFEHKESTGGKFWQFQMQPSRQSTVGDNNNRYASKPVKRPENVVAIYNTANQNQSFLFSDPVYLSNKFLPTVCFPNYRTINNGIDFGNQENKPAITVFAWDHWDDPEKIRWIDPSESPPPKKLPDWISILISGGEVTVTIDYSRMTGANREDRYFVLGSPDAQVTDRTYFEKPGKGMPNILEKEEHRFKLSDGMKIGLLKANDLRNAPMDKVTRWQYTSP